MRYLATTEVRPRRDTGWAELGGRFEYCITAKGRKHLEQVLRRAEPERELGRISLAELNQPLPSAGLLRQRRQRRDYMRRTRAALPKRAA